ncbi:MAG TPA: glycosyltransferase [Bacillales bacterium]|nr:glycosyltransferase [Bacillales bacterium]
MGKQKVLILTGQYGEGHKQAASAIQAEMERQNIHVESMVLDPASLVHPTLDLISRNVFIEGVKKFPSVYNFCYEKTRRDNFASTVLKGMNRLGIWRLLKLLNEMHPSVIVSTCPIASGMISNLKEQGFINIPLITVITDYSAHSYWVYPYTDAYFAGSDSVREGLEQLGVDGAKIAVTGIPVDPKFGGDYNREVLRLKYGLERNMPTVLITGGGYGMIGKGNTVFQAFEKIPFDMQIIVVCGHNERLYHQLEQKMPSLKHKILLMGYVDHIEELMAVSDLMVTKPGGLTVSEAIAMSLPMLLYPSIGGQEHDNTQFLLKTKTALLASDTEDLTRKVFRMLTDRNVLLTLRNHAKQLQRKHTAFDAVEVILDMLSSSQVDFRFA